MPAYGQELNVAMGGHRTAARYDTDVEKWLTDSAMWVKNAAGIYVPVSDADPIPCKLTGSSVPLSQPVPTQRIPKVVISTIINAQSVGAGLNTGFVSVGADGTEDEVWVATNIDQQPWTLNAKNIFGASGAGGCYPQFYNKATAYASLIGPALGLLLGIIPSVQGVPDPSSITLAKDTRLPLNSAVEVSVINGSASTATVTVKIIRIWR